MRSAIRQDNPNLDFNQPGRYYRTQLLQIGPTRARANNNEHPDKEIEGIEVQNGIRGGHTAYAYVRM